MLCKKHQYFVLYRGDDTDFPGNQELIVEINTTRDLTGCSAHFQFQDYRIDFDSIPADKKLHLVFPASETKKFTLGASDAKLWLTYGSGTDEKKRTVENRIHIIVTNNVNEAYNNDDPQAITVTIATIVLDDTVTEESQNGVKSSGIWSWVKSLLPNWLTSDYAEPATVSSVANKRDKDDLAVYKLVKSAFVLHKDGLTDVTLPFIGKDQSKPYPYNEYDWVFQNEGSTWFYAIVFSDGRWKLNVDDGAEYGYSSASEDALRIEFDNGYVATRSSIISSVPVDDQQLAAVATGDAQTPANGDLVKYDATNDRFVKAVAGTDYIPFINDLDGNKTAATIGSRKSGESVGPHSIANGYNVIASVYASHAEGESTTTSGNFSHAEGKSTTALGYASHSEGIDTTASGDFSHAEGKSTTASGAYSHAEGYFTTASGNYSHSEGISALTRADDRFSYAWNGDGDRENQYSSHGQGTFNINPAGGLAGFYIGEQTLPQVISAAITGKADKATTLSGYGITDGATKESIAPEYSATSAYSVGAIVYYDGNIYQCKTAIAEGGEAWNAEKWELRKLGDFFTESNSLLTGTIDDRLPIPISEKSAGFTTESYKRFVVTVSSDMTVTLHTPTSGDAEIFECRFNGSSLSADASITFAGATATTMDTDCGTVTAGKVALMSAFWNGSTWDVNWKVEG